MSMELAFPFLESEGFTQTSPAAGDYNCIAWAAGRTDVAWWPDPQGIGYWPEGAPRAETLDAFCRAFESIGYSRRAPPKLAMKRSHSTPRKGGPSTRLDSWPMGVGPVNWGRTLTLRTRFGVSKGRCMVRCTAL
jgi:hypothetical protein